MVKIFFSSFFFFFWWWDHALLILCYHAPASQGLEFLLCAINSGKGGWTWKNSWNVSNAAWWRTNITFWVSLAPLTLETFKTDVEIPSQGWDDLPGSGFALGDGAFGIQALGSFTMPQGTQAPSPDCGVHPDLTFAVLSVTYNCPCHPGQCFS